MQSYGSITITDLTDKSVKSVYAFYKSTSSAQAPDAPTAPQEGVAPSGWSTQVTTSSSNPYAWMIIITYYTDGDAYVSQPSQVGNHASSITNVTNEIRYAKGDSSTNPPQTGWQVDPTTTSTTNPYLWTRITPIVTIDSTPSRLASSYMVSVPIEGISENAVKSTTQLWRTSSTTPVVPTGHQSSRITISTTDYSSGWNPMSPAGSSSGTVVNFSNLWYITETQYLDGTYEYTQPQRDANYHIVNAIGVFKNDLASNSGTTVIDGGHIYGGTLTLGGRDNGRGQLRIQDENDIEIGKWDNSGVSISKGTLELGLTNFFPDPETSGFRVKDNGEFGVGSFNNQGLIKGLYWDGNNLNVKGTIYAGEESNIYTMEQVNDIQESLEDQASTLENAIAASDMTLSDLAEEYQYTKMDVSGLLDHLNLINKFVVVNSDGYILLGASDDETRTPLRIRIDGTAIGFYDGEIDETDLTINRVAWLLNSRDEGDSTLHIENAEIENAQRIGDFVWQKRGQDRLTLMYSPV